MVESNFILNLQIVEWRFLDSFSRCFARSRTHCHELYIIAVIIDCGFEKTEKIRWKCGRFIIYNPHWQVFRKRRNSLESIWRAIHDISFDEYDWGKTLLMSTHTFRFVFWIWVFHFK